MTSAKLAVHHAGGRKGMTLVEVLAVVILLGLIATTLTLSFRGQVGRAKTEIARTGIGVIVNAIETYALETGSIPSTQQGLAVLTETPQGRGAPYLSPDKLNDPWGNRYAYVEPGPEGSAYQVICYGADGQPGGTAGTEDADITSDDLGGSSQHSQ
ncbi:MAG: type II secretion system major pseudopilin GspG [Phycisphaerales bacterium]